ncbi:MAG: hypothetical protein OHK003_32780 [Anaerolineales bacterium]
MPYLLASLYGTTPIFGYHNLARAIAMFQSQKKKNAFWGQTRSHDVKSYHIVTALVKYINLLLN